MKSNLIKTKKTLYISIVIFLLLPIYLTAQSLLPEFSVDAGFYNSAIDVEITVDHPDAEIYYTTDGSVPTQQSDIFSGSLVLEPREGDQNIFSEIPTNNIGAGHIYREDWRSPAGEVFKIHVLRAKAFLPNDESGDVATASYIIDTEGTERFSMPVFSVVTNPDNFFSDETGIYVHGSSDGNFYQRGREWEREIHLEFFEADGQKVIAQDAGVRIHGGTSRNRPRKTLRFYARSDYGTSWFNYPLFPDKPVSRYKRFLLRNSGNDWSESLFRDAYLQRLIQENTNLDLQYSRPAILFINGEYWGIHNIRDRFDDRYLQSHYNVDDDRVIIMENNAEYDDGNEEGIESYNELYNFVTNSSMANTANFAEASLMMDMENFIDYQILNIYTRNTDWPGNNVRYWRYLDGDPDTDSPYGRDGRWRWMAFDLDFGFGLDFDYVAGSGSSYGGNNPQHNTINFALETSGPSWPNPPWSTAMLRSLMQNDQFRTMFINRFADLLNTSFKSERAVELLDSMKETYEAEMDEHIHRWREPTRSHWENDVQTIRTFAAQREDAMRQIINNRFDLGGSETLKLSVNNPAEGTIKVNSVTLASTLPGVDEGVFPWEGTYFKNQTIQLIAKPKLGYTFSGWSGSFTSDADTLTVSITPNLEIQANFEEGDLFQGDEMNPAPFQLSEGAYLFNYWSEDEPEGSFPPHMVFQQSSVDDPRLEDEMTDPYVIPFTDEDNNEYHSNDQDKFGFPYKLTGRTRINGLGSDGISLINTGRGRDLGAVVLALDTRGVGSSSSLMHTIEWEAQTLEANSRVYHLRPQYRIGLTGEWRNFVEGDKIIEYQRNEDTNDITYYQHYLDEDMLDQPYLQVRWKYYYTGTRLSEDFGQRDKIRLNNISTATYGVSTEITENPSGFELKQNFPNPFNPTTTIIFYLDKPMDVRLEVFDLLGRRISLLVDQKIGEGIHEAEFEASELSSGMYIYKLTANGNKQARQMMLVK